MRAAAGSGVPALPSFPGDTGALPFSGPTPAARAAFWRLGLPEPARAGEKPCHHHGLAISKKYCGVFAPISPLQVVRGTAGKDGAAHTHPIRRIKAAAGQHAIGHARKAVPGERKSPGLKTDAKDHGLRGDIHTGKNALAGVVVAPARVGFKPDPRTMSVVNARGNSGIGVVRRRNQRAIEPGKQPRRPGGTVNIVTQDGIEAGSPSQGDAV